MRDFSFYCKTFLYCLLISTSVNSQIQKIYLHPKATTTEKQSRFIDSIRFIPLQTAEGVQVGAWNYVEVTDKYFFIVHYPDKTILLYTRNGAFVKKISYKKLGENFSPRFEEHTNRIVFFGNNKNYTLTPKDEIKIALDWNNPRNKKYFKKHFIDLDDPSLEIQKDIPDQNDIIHANHYYEDFYWQGEIITSPLYQDSLDHEFKIYKNNKLVRGFFPYNRINEPRFLYREQNVSFDNTDIPYIHHLTRPFCDTIYKVVRDSSFPIYKLVLPLENTVPQWFYTKPFKSKTERENFERNNGWMFRQIYSFHETPKFIYFSVGYLSNGESYIYQKQTNITYRTRNIKPDSSQYNLQLLTRGGTMRKGERFYKTVKTEDLVAFFEKNKDAQVPKELEGFLKSKPSGTAPVIVEFKLKN
jgi:hypothetical protein